MTNELMEKPKGMNALEALAMRLQVSKETLQTTLQKTAFKDCKTNEEFITCVIVANNYNLNPFLKEIYAFSGKGGGIIPIVPIDGWVRIATSHPQYDGVEQIENEGPDGKLKSITTKFYRKDTSHPTVITEYLEECARDTEPWKKWPRRMLGHKSYIQCARKAFGFAGIYDEDEAQRIIEAQATIVPEEAKQIEMPRAKQSMAETPSNQAAEPEVAAETAPKAAMASPAQVKNLNALAEQAGLKDMDYVDFLAERCEDPAKITVPELQKCLTDVAAMIDKKAKKK